MSKKTVIYGDRESRTLEFKSKLPEFSKLIKTCIAFANGVGGQIVIGVEDETRELIGVTDMDRDRLYEALLHNGPHKHFARSRTKIYRRESSRERRV